MSDTDLYLHEPMWIEPYFFFFSALLFLSKNSRAANYK